MSQEPKICCPGCGTKAWVMTWFTDVPGEGFGAAECPRCGMLDYIVKNGRVRKVVPAVNVQDLEENPEEPGYDADLMEYLMEEIRA